MQAVSQFSLRYVAPGDVSSTIALSATTSYQGSSAGFIDVPADGVDGNSFAIPFGSVAAPKQIAIQNNTLLAVEIAVNGSEDVWTLGAGDLMVLGGPAALGITSISAILTASQSEAGSISYVVLGD